MDERKAVAGNQDGTPLLEAGEESRVAGGQRAPWPDRVGHPHAGRREPGPGVAFHQISLAQDLAHAVGAQRLIGHRFMDPEVFGHRLDEAPAVHRDRAGEHVVAHPPVEQLDQRLEITHLIRSIVKHHVEVLNVRSQGGAQLAWNAPVGVDALDPGGQFDHMAVGDRHLESPSRQFADQAQPDVAVAPDDQDTHTINLSSLQSDAGTPAPRRLY